LCIAACGPSLDKDISELVSAKNKWLENFGKKDYSFIYKRNCFCSFDDKKILIKVKNHKLISASINGEEIDPKTMPTIRQLFEMILEQIKKREIEENTYIVVEYNSDLGYPEIIRIKNQNIDGGGTLYVSDVAAM
jgi:hypothetical protein